MLDKVTVETARASAVKHLAAEFLDESGAPLAKWTARMKEPMRPVRAVRQHPGGFDVPEILRLASAQSTVHVAGMGRDDGGVHLEAWVTMPVRQVPDRMAPERDWTPVAQAMVEAVERVLRSLAQLEAGDETLPLLDVQTRCLYDSQVQPRGAVTLWGLRVTWPALAAAPQGTAGGPLAAANAWLTPALDGALRAELGPRPDDPEAAAAWERDVAGRVAATVPQRQWHALHGRLPSITVEHGGGTIRQHGQELLRWVDDAGVPRMQQVRGLREWLVTVRCWDSTEARSDGLLQEVLARIGRSWTWYHVTQRVKVARLLPPAHDRGAVVTGAELTMLAVVPTGEAQRLPLLRPEYASRQVSALEAAYDPAAGTLTVTWAAPAAAGWTGYRVQLRRSGPRGLYRGNLQWEAEAGATTVTIADVDAATGVQRPRVGEGYRVRVAALYTGRDPAWVEAPARPELRSETRIGLEGN